LDNSVTSDVLKKLPDYNADIADARIKPMLVERYRIGLFENFVVLAKRITL
jgi:hypothetical protein